MHIDLTEENKDKILRAAGELNLSPTQLVNSILAAVQSVEIRQFITLKPPKENLVNAPQKLVKKSFKRVKNFVTDF